MKKYQINRLSALVAVLLVMTQNIAIWENNKAVVRAMKMFKAAIDLLRGSLGVQDAGTKVITTSKNELEDFLIKQIYLLSGALYAIAIEIDDAAMKLKVQTTMPALKNLRDEQLVGACRNIFGETKNWPAELDAYDYNDAKLTEIGELIDAYEQNYTAPRTAISTRKASTGLIPAQQAKAVEVLDHVLLPLVTEYKDSHPEFYASVMNAKMVVDKGIRYEKEEEAEKGEAVDPDEAA